MGGWGRRVGRRGGHPTRRKRAGEGVSENEGGRVCCDAPVADLALPPLINPDRSLCFILRPRRSALSPAK